ncbi:glutathione S-transferase [Coniophora puteana RWD-64-598 SS2]|uniref:glutathione transferase n=1 Tax=Coniophora puteana (strain RWD-64-598) TaxID=741705 RepID=A0A5M3MNG7_CONPW|nr:glutathione S-transferase [Coniophora puteana RWD-64-598 SS2]EIW80586.1 glutathione S-transferase [Coniophora puteana RWD-64-598 SS2]
MVLKVYGNPASPCTRTVTMVCKELNLPYEVVVIDFTKGEHKLPEYIKKQPFGQIPYIDDDGFVLYESRAIARYLASKYANADTAILYPSDFQGRALVEQAASIEAFNFYPSVYGAVSERIFKPAFRGQPTDETRLQEHLSALNPKLDAYDKILDTQKYLTGDNFTLADLFHIAYSALLEQAGLGSLFESRPNVARWWKDIAARESWLAVKDAA